MLNVDFFYGVLLVRRSICLQYPRTVTLMVNRAIDYVKMITCKICLICIENIEDDDMTIFEVSIGD
jgi:hypothetical protein